jgi:hypothetical protein
VGVEESEGVKGRGGVEGEGPSRVPEGTASFNMRTFGADTPYARGGRERRGRMGGERERGGTGGKGVGGARGVSGE